MNQEDIAARRSKCCRNAEETVPKRTYTAIELFAGAGGLALGLEQAGFHTMGAFEWNKDAVETLRHNRPDWNVVKGDITEIASNGFHRYLSDKEVDVLSGGPPCQAFSYAGKRLGLEDTRGTLFYSYAKALVELQPKAFLLENVKGLLSHDGGRTFATILDVLQECGYDLQWTVLNAHHYGVAQKRERMLVVGIRMDVKAEEKEAFAFPKPHAARPVLRDALRNVPASIGMMYSEKRRAVLEQVPAGGNWKSLPADVARDFMGAAYEAGGGKTGMAKRLSWNEAAPTLTTSPSQKQTERCHPEETRPLTVREYARIQSFPDEWEFQGGLSAQYKQIGNAVPVRLAQSVGKALIHYLNQF